MATGIGPEIMSATLHILKEAGARLDIETIEIGEKSICAATGGKLTLPHLNLCGEPAFLKAPITTPQGIRRST